MWPAWLKSEKYIQNLSQNVTNCQIIWPTWLEVSHSQGRLVHTLRHKASKLSSLSSHHCHHHLFLTICVYDKHGMCMCLCMCMCMCVRLCICVRVVDKPLCFLRDIRQRECKHADRMHLSSK